MLHSDILLYFREALHLWWNIMAKLIQKLPALLATTREVATPKLNTFWRYAKVTHDKRQLSFHV